MKDCDLAAAIRTNAVTPSGMSGDEILGRLVLAMDRVARRRPWAYEREVERIEREAAA